jgi:hypothetical protein
VLKIITHSWSCALLEKVPIVQPFKKFPAFYGTRRFITVFTRAFHWSLSWARSIQSIPSHPNSLRSILILSTHLRLSHQYPTCSPLVPHSCYMPCPPHPPWLDNSNYTWRRVQAVKNKIRRKVTGSVLRHMSLCFVGKFSFFLLRYYTFKHLAALRGSR